MMPEYLNPHNYAVHLIDQDGKEIRVKPHQKVVLSEFFDKYRARGFLRLAETQPTPQAVFPKVQAKIKVGDTRPKATAPAKPPPKPKQNGATLIRKAAIAAKTARIKSSQPRQVVGRAVNRDANELFQRNLDRNNYPISNGIGVGILSYNRAGSLRRLVNSIIKNTDLRRTTIFVSDDGSTDPATATYLTELASNQNFVILRNQSRGGIACNSNRLLRCLSRFQYGILLNDDVEIVSRDWEHFYVDVMKKTGLHHLMYRQSGVYGAELGTTVQKSGLNLLRVNDKPHGAVLAFTNKFLQTVGYFDESYGLYGMEHVDWSQRAWELGLQESGFYDALGSDSYFKLYAESSAVQGRSQLLQEARAAFSKRRAAYTEPSKASLVPEISYVVPFRNFERAGSIVTVMNNLRAQRFPQVHLVMVEQDSETRVDLASYSPVNYYLAKSTDNPLFNKSKAFNLGVARAPSDMVILHDADMLAQGHYTQAVADILAKHESCHIGSTVLYTKQSSMLSINNTGVVDKVVQCDRVVGYYEGGSLAATKRGFWKCGGFNEDYWGYGCEDCDFYARLSETTDWKENRTFDFLHLWHSRVGGWHGHHEANRVLEGSLKRLKMAERVARQHQQLRSLGYSQELTKAMQ